MAEAALGRRAHGGGGDGIGFRFLVGFRVACLASIVSRTQCQHMIRNLIMAPISKPCCNRCSNPSGNPCLISKAHSIGT